MAPGTKKSGLGLNSRSSTGKDGRSAPVVGAGKAKPKAEGASRASTPRTFGHGIVERLLERVGAGQIGVSVRDPRKAEDLASRGVRVRRGDFDDAASLRDAFEGASRVLIVSSNARASGGDPIAQHRAAPLAAGEVGARRVLYTSHMGASATSAFPPMHDHAATS
ncbi:NAD(P)H-binding protein [Sorangium sp. So ce1014]